MTDDDVTYIHHDAESAAPLFAELIGVYLDAHVGDGPFYTEDRYRRQLVGRMRADGWSLVAAHVDDEMAGYIYGFPLSTSTRWWNGLETALPEDFTREDGRRTFALCELLVRPVWRRRGIAEALHEKLLSGRSEERATLLARPDNAPAQAAYAEWGWQKVAKLRPAWENAPRFDVLTRDLA